MQDISMAKRILIEGGNAEEKRVVLLAGGKVQDFDLETSSSVQRKGNVYLAKVVKVEPALQAAFVEFYEGRRHGFLPFGEIHPDCYRLPEEDRKKVSVESEEVTEEGLPKRKPDRRYRIQDVVFRGQTVVVQVTKDERATKGATLSTYIALPGRFCLLMPNNTSKKNVGVSRKIEDAAKRESLKAIAEQIQADLQRMSIVLRSASADATKAEIKRDFEYLTTLWEEMRRKALFSSSPALLYEEGDLIAKSLRDVCKRDVDEIVVEGEDAYRRAKHILKTMMPSHVRRLKLHKGTSSLFQHFGVEEQLENMYKQRVQLPSGGSLVIQPTEALVSIDVNSSRSMAENNIDDTALKTNLEAADEIARQLRLRDLAGLIVVDFIDMSKDKNHEQVEKRFADAMKTDRARFQIGKISDFGLLELSRQRLRPSFLEFQALECVHCHGEGVVFSQRASALRLLRGLERELEKKAPKHLRIYANTDLLLFVLNKKKSEIVALEKRFHATVECLLDHSGGSSDFRFETDNAFPDVFIAPEPPAKPVQKHPERPPLPKPKPVLPKPTVPAPSAPQNASPNPRKKRWKPRPKTLA